MFFLFRMGKKKRKSNQTRADSDEESNIPLSELIAIQDAKAISQALNLSLNDEIVKQLKSLDRLCRGNGLKRIQIARDGLCLIKAVILQLEPSPHLDSFCMELCNHMKSKKSSYLNYLTSTEYDFDGEFAKLRSGIWNTDLCDVLPLAIANMLQLKLVVFKSDLRVVDINPTIDEISAWANSLLSGYF